MSRRQFFLFFYIMICYYLFLTIIILMNKVLSYKSLSKIAWDLWCAISIVGIWPRYIEPNLVSVSRIQLKIPNLPVDLDKIKILQISDLHLNKQFPDAFLNKIIRKCQLLKPDLIVFTGDFICHGKLDDPKRLHHFLSELKAPYGSFCILGNHDYQEYVSIDNAGDYTVINREISPIVKGWRRVLRKAPVPTKKISEKAKKVPLNSELVALLKKSSFELLHNQTKFVPIKSSGLNISGLGEYILGRLQPEIAFQNFDKSYPGIVLAHNPDSIPYLQDYPGDVILCGHTHGGQVNLPFLRNRFSIVENREYLRGLFQVENKYVYVNRGLRGAMNFRWFSMPELLLLTLSADQ